MIEKPLGLELFHGPFPVECRSTRRRIEHSHDEDGFVTKPDDVSADCALLAVIKKGIGQKAVKLLNDFVTNIADHGINSSLVFSLLQIGSEPILIKLFCRAPLKSITQGCRMARSPPCGGTIEFSLVAFAASPVLLDRRGTMTDGVTLTPALRMLAAIPAIVEASRLVNASPDHTTSDEAEQFEPPCLGLRGLAERMAARRSVQWVGWR